MNRIKVGKIVNAVGLKGEVKIYPYTDYKERFEELDGVYVDKTYMKIEKVRYMKNLPIVKFEGVNDRNQSEALKEKFCTIDKKDLRELGEDEYFIFDLIGLKVVDQNGKDVGIICDVIENPAHDLYEIEGAEGKKFLLPAVKEFIIDTDIKSGIMNVKLIEGLID